MPLPLRPALLLAALGAVAIPLVLAACRDTADAAPPELTWRELSASDAEGRGWGGSDLAAPYDRLPARAEKTVPSSVTRPQSLIRSLHSSLPVCRVQSALRRRGRAGCARLPG